MQNIYINIYKTYKLGKISGIIIVTPSTFDSFKNFKRGKMRLKRGGGHIGIPFKGQIL